MVTWACHNNTGQILLSQTVFPELTNKWEKILSLANYIMWVTEVAIRVRFPISEFVVFFFTPCRAVLRLSEPLLQWVQKVLSENIKCPCDAGAEGTSMFCSVYYSANAHFI